MKTWLFILAAVFTGVALYVYLDPQLNKQVKREFNDLLPSQQTTTLYKWYDKQGRPQITDLPPPEGIKYELVEYRHDANVLPSEAFTGKPKE